MKTKLLLGSIGAVIILILVSFTNVIGVQSTSSLSVNQSPLFSIRTQTAINEKSQKLATEYLNKGENTLTIPPSNRNNALFQKLIQRISTMDDESFNHFIIVVLNQISHRNLLKDTTPLKIEITLHQIRNNPNLIRNYLNQKENEYSYTAPSCMQCTIGNWVPSCFLSEFIMILLRIISNLIDIIVEIQTALGIGNCGTYCCTIDHGCSFFPGS